MAMLEQKHLNMTEWPRGKLGSVNANVVLDAVSFLICVCFHHASSIYPLTFQACDPCSCQHASLEHGVMGALRPCWRCCQAVHTSPDPETKLLTGLWSCTSARQGEMCVSWWLQIDSCTTPSIKHGVGWSRGLWNHLPVMLICRNTSFLI